MSSRAKGVNRAILVPVKEMEDVGVMSKDSGAASSLQTV
jgi:hypothetical protein